MHTLDRSLFEVPDYHPIDSDREIPQVQTILKFNKNHTIYEASNKSIVPVMMTLAVFQTVSTVNFATAM